MAAEMGDESFATVICSRVPDGLVWEWKGKSDLFLVAREYEPELLCHVKSGSFPWAIEKVGFHGEPYTLIYRKVGDGTR